MSEIYSVPLEQTAEAFGAQDDPKVDFDVVVQNLESEYPPKKNGKITLQEAIIDDQDFLQRTQLLIDYREQTRSCDTRSQAALFLTEIARRMARLMPRDQFPLPIENIRVVILQRGIDPSADVIADGTIFMSQSLINRAESLDILGFVIGHEIGHIFNKTSLNKNNAGSSEEALGVSWTHELASDSLALELSVKAGFQSLAGDELKRFLSSGRSSVHQSGLTRSTQMVGQHGIIDYETSSNVITPKPDFLHREIMLTHLDLFRQALKEKDETSLFIILEKLHPLDLKQAMGMLSEHRLNKLIEVFLMKRMRSLGLDEKEILLALLLSPVVNKTIYHNISDLDHVRDILKDMPKMIRKENQTEKTPYKMIDEKLFGILEADDDYQSPRDFLEWMSVGITFYSDEKKVSKDTKNIQISEDEFIVFMSDVIHYDDTYWRNVEKRTPAGEIKEIHCERSFALFLIQYVEGNCLSADDSLDFIKTESVLKKLALLFPKMTQKWFTYYSFDTYLYKGKNTKDDFFKIFKEIIPAEERKSNKFLVEEISKLSKKMRYQGIESALTYNNAFRNGTLLRRIQELSENLARGTEQERKRIFDDLCDLTQTMPFSSNVDILHIFSDFNFDSHNFSENKSPNEHQSKETTSLNQEIFNFIWKTMALRACFPVSTEQFYLELENLIKVSNIPWEQCSQVQLTNLFVNILFIDKSYASLLSENEVEQRISLWYSGKVDWERLFKISEIQKIVSLDSKREFKNLQEILDSIQKKKLIFSSDRTESDIEVSSDSFASLVLFQSEQEAILKFLSNPIGIAEYPLMLEALDIVFRKDVRKNAFQRYLIESYLHSELISLEGKTDFLIKHFSTVGISGIEILASQIFNRSQYSIFRERLRREKLDQYLHANTESTALAVVDNGASRAIALSAKELIDTTSSDLEHKREFSTKSAQHWFNTFDRVHFDGKKFVLGQNERVVFTSFRDSVQSLHEMSSAKRSGLVFKALTEVGGLLEDKNKRLHISRSARKGLNLSRDSIVNILLESLVENGKPEILSFSLTELLAPLLFNSLDTDLVDQESVKNYQVYDSKTGAMKYRRVSDIYGESVSEILESHTRDIVFFGSKYAHQQDSEIAQLAQKSDKFYSSAVEICQQQFTAEKRPEKSSADREKESMTSNEVILKALQRSGATVVRQMQLASQFYDFDSNVEKMLLDTLDSNPGMSMATMWENVYRWSDFSEQEQKAWDLLQQPKLLDSDREWLRVNLPSENEQIKFIQSLYKKSEFRQYLDGVEIIKKIGGGSLNTVLLVRKKDTGENRVLRLKNPNAAYFVKQGHDLVSEAYDNVPKLDAIKFEKEIRIGKMLNDLSYRWCLADIANSTFVLDDSEFRTVISSANLGPKVVISAPEIGLTQEKIKEEQAVSGVTAKEFLLSAASEAQKKEVRQAIVEFSKHQFNFAKNKKRVFGQQEYVLSHSDQHMGNFIVEFKDDILHLYVIDRDMYLKLEEPDVEIARYLQEGNTAKFLLKLIDRILDKNKIRGRDKFTKKVSLLKETLPKVVKAFITGKGDAMSNLQTLFNAMSEKKLDIPLEIILMIRNIEGNRRLESGFGTQQATSVSAF